ncbi:hypothetical protein [Streptomyces sparsogenes]|uniref:Peptidase M10 metallopeptidase domain-containing protein n=1 Tax=Streptomyces sparsogenes DSM 40356 TaxID=1331668 RepID=A0A1R1SNE6_9ACTN|nr:hypothetical protein [Streptomyces sparsogenes]OMI39826.1 hypothetical protein SPAR_08951 [Streptomyces sparsogenes DSM 40356]
MKKLGGVALAAALATVFATASTASAANEGTGWKLESGSPYFITNLAHNSTYTISFVTQKSRGWLTSYLKVPVQQLNAMPEVKNAGIKFVLSTTIEGGTNYQNKKYCAGPQHHIMFLLKYRPLDGKKGMSRALPCYNTKTNAAWGGYVEMDTEYWTSTGKENSWFGSNKTKAHAMTLNAVTHELGHMMGLDHPDPSKFSPNENKPVMTSPNGGYLNSNGGKFTAADLRGIRKLVSNGA